MDERQRLRQTITRFRSEVERVLDATFVDMPVPLLRLLDALDCEPVISAYLAECTGTHLPAGFDATGEVDRVSQTDGATFGPYPADARAMTGEVYLIVQELAARGPKCHDAVFQGYGQGTSQMSAIARNFTEDVMVRLIDSVSDHLSQQAARLGIDDTEGSPDAPAPATPAGTTGDTPQSPGDLLDRLAAAISQLSDDTRADARLQAEALADELAEPSPKRSVVGVLLRGLRLLGDSPAATDAIDQLEGYLYANEIL